MDKEEKKKKTEQKDELMENDRRYPVEQCSNTRFQVCRMYRLQLQKRMV